MNFTSLEAMRALSNTDLLTNLSKLTFLHGSSNKESIQEILEHIYGRGIVSIDFFIHFLNTNEIHLNDAQYLRDLIARDFFKNGNIEYALEFKPSGDSKGALEMLKSNESFEF